MQAPEANDWLATFGVAPQAASADETWIQAVTLTPEPDETLTLSWNLYEGSLRLVWRRETVVRVDAYRDGVKDLRLEDPPGKATYILADYQAEDMVGSLAVQVWPHFGLTDSLHYDYR